MNISGVTSSLYPIRLPDAVHRRRPSDAAEEEAAAAASAFSGAVAQVQIRADAQSRTAGEVAPIAEAGTDAEAGQGGGERYAQPGGSPSNASELLRLLGANTEGYNAAAAPNGVRTDRPSFFQEVLKSFSDAGRASQLEGRDFTSYMKDLLHAAYGK